MIQESSTWDMRAIQVHPSVAEKLYVLFLFAVVIVVVGKLAMTWRIALPLRLSKKRDDRAALESMMAIAASLKQWTILTVLGCALFSFLEAYDQCERVIMSKATGGRIVLYVVQDLARYCVMGGVVILLAFLVRWYILKRIEYLRRIQAST